MSQSGPRNMTFAVPMFHGRIGCARALPKALDDIIDCHVLPLVGYRTQLPHASRTSTALTLNLATARSPRTFWTTPRRFIHARDPCRMRLTQRQASGVRSGHAMHRASTSSGPLTCRAKPCFLTLLSMWHGKPRTHFLCGQVLAGTSHSPELFAGVSTQQFWPWCGSLFSASSSAHGLKLSGWSSSAS